MWQNYFTIAVRALSKNRLFTILNLIGLAIGMAAFLLIALWVRNETTYDHWIPEADRIFVVQSTIKEPGQDAKAWRSSPAVMLPFLQQDFPQIESGTRLLNWDMPLKYGTRLESQPILFGDSGFFDTLKFPLLAGDVGRFKLPNQIVVSNAFAQKWFGREPAVGQTIEMVVKGEKRPYIVAAVMQDFPANSMFKFDVVAPLVVADFSNMAWMFQGWNSFNPMTIIKLRSPADASALREGAEAFVAKHNPPAVKGENAMYYRPVIVNIQDSHLQTPNVSGYFKDGGDANLVKVIAATGFLILAIAIITYINLATARVSLRAREVGVRKTVGATRSQLVTQFLVESCVLALGAACLALALIEVTMPIFNSLIEQAITLNYLGTNGVLLPLIVLWIVVGLTGGWYPALVLSRLNPRDAVHGAISTSSTRSATSKLGGGSALRVTLVVAQFAVAVLLVTCMTIIYLQVVHLRNVDLGFKGEGLITVSQLERSEVKPQQQAFMDEVKKIPGVTFVTRSIFTPGTGGDISQSAVFEGMAATAVTKISAQIVDYDFLRTYDAKLVAGRDFSRDIASDDVTGLEPEALAKRTNNVVINRSMLKYFNTADPQAAIGKSFQIAHRKSRFALTVVGVVEDIRMRPAREQSTPTYFSRAADGYYAMSIRFSGVAPAEMRQRLERKWSGFFPDTPFQSRLMQTVVNGFYAAEANRGNLFAACAGLAFVLCMLGMFGLAVFTAERRTKEIGIRKVLGASATEIMRLLMWQFLKPICLSILIAWPLAWWLMRDCLNGFSDRIPLTPTPFILSALLAMLIAGVTVAAHALMVARVSPVKALRHE